MKRKMVYAGAAWSAGLITAAVIGYVPVVLAVSAASALFLKCVLHFELKAVLFMLLVFILAFGHFHLYDMLVYRTITDMSGNKISFEGTVTDVKDYSGDNSAYILDGRINGEISGRLIVNTGSVSCEPGDKMNLECKAEAFENNYLFDSTDYYKSKGIFLNSYEAENIEVDDSGFSLRRLLFRFRERVSAIIQKSVPVRESGMIKGMLFGDKSGIDDEDMTMLYRTGIGHVTAVSGLHLVLFCTFISFILNRLRAGAVTGFIISEIFMLMFALCCGMSVSVMRAFIMMTLVNSAVLFFRHSDPLNSICIAVILLTIQNPFVVTNQSFLLSVSGAIGAGVFAPYMTEKMKTDNLQRRCIKNGVYLLCVSLVVTPVSVICFGEVSFISPLSNMLVTPLCMAAIAVAMIAAIVGLFCEPYLLFKISGAICRMVMNISDIAGRNSLTYGKLRGEYLSFIIAALLVLCVVGFLIFKSRKYCVIAVVISGAVIFGVAGFDNISDSMKLKITLLGKSDTDVIIVSKNGNTDIIDISGAYKNSRYAAKYLDDNGISEINNILLTKNPYSGISAYNDKLSLCRAYNAYVPAGSFLKEGITLCGSVPEYSGFNSWTADYCDYAISVSDDFITIDMGERHFEFERDSEDKSLFKPCVEFYITDSGEVDMKIL